MLRHVLPGVVPGVAPRFCPVLTTVVAGKPSAESFDRLPPRQLAASGRVQALQNVMPVCCCPAILILCCYCSCLAANDYNAPVQIVSSAHYTRAS